MDLFREILMQADCQMADICLRRAQDIRTDHHKERGSEVAAKLRNNAKGMTEEKEFPPCLL